MNYTQPVLEEWSRREDLNPQPSAYKAAALPIELPTNLNLSPDAYPMGQRRLRGTQ